MSQLTGTLRHEIPGILSAGLKVTRAALSELFDRAAKSAGGKTWSPSEASVKEVTTPARQHSVTIFSLNNAIPQSEPERALFTPSATLSKKMGDLVAQVQSVLTREAAPDSALTKLLEDFNGVFERKMSLATASQTIIGDLLQIMKPLAFFALDLVDAVQQAFFELLADLIDVVMTTLDTQITRLSSSLQWVNNLYKKISGGTDLSILELSALLVAAPGTLAHRLVTGKSLVDPAFVIPERLQFDLKSPSSPGPAANPEDLKLAAKIMELAYRFLAGVWYMLFDPILSGWRNAYRSVVWYIDHATKGGGTAPRVPGWLATAKEIVVVVGAIETVVSFLVDALGIVAEYLRRSLTESKDKGGGIGLPSGFTIFVFVGNLLIKAAVIGSHAFEGLPTHKDIFKMVFGLAYALLRTADHIWGMCLPPTGRAGEVARFYMRHGVGLAKESREIFQLGIPIGTKLVTHGGKVAIAGAALVVLNFNADRIVTFLAGGVLSSTAWWEAFDFGSEGISATT